MGKNDGEYDVETGPTAVAEGVLAEYLIEPVLLSEPPRRTDTLTPAARSERMSRIHGKDTQPEMKVRRLVYGMG
ncbi:MAG: hypothetical protein R6X17_01435, partial [Candidatus Competibacteraceae bacterium]